LLPDFPTANKDIDIEHCTITSLRSRVGIMAHGATPAQSSLWQWLLHLVTRCVSKYDTGRPSSTSSSASEATDGRTLTERKMELGSDCYNFDFEHLQ